MSKAESCCTHPKNIFAFLKICRGGLSNRARRESDAAYVTMHYFSFLERDPDPLGFEGWMKALAVVDRDSFTRSFTASIEYQGKRNAPR